MSEKFKEPKAPRFGMWPLITAGFASAVALGLFAITPAEAGFLRRIVWTAPALGS